MKKLVFIISVLITIFLMFLIKNGEFTPNEAVIMVNRSLENSKIILPRNPIIKEDEFIGLIISDPQTVNFSSELKKHDFENFIILSDNINNFGKFKFAFKDVLKNFSHISSGKSEFAFSHNVFDETLRDKLGEYYKNPNIISISLKPGISEEEMMNFSKYLIEYLEGDTLIISGIKYSSIENKIVKAFHDDYTKHILSLLDATKIDKLDIKNMNSLKAFFAVSKELSLVHNLNSDFNSAFYYDKNGKVSERSLYISAFGDVMMGRYVRTLMDINGHDYPFENIKDQGNSFFKGSDLVFANLEGPIKGDGFKSSTSMIFGFPEYVAPLLKSYGFDLLMLANNHALNQGISGRESTIQALEEQNIGWCGNPKDVDPESVYYSEVSGKKFAFVCFNDVEAPLDDEKAKSLVKEVSDKVDLLIVSAHFGVEYKHSASDSMQVIPAHDWIDNGADFVIGHHSHVVQNFEIYKGKFIFYSLGNFVFDQYWSKDTQEELGLGIELNKKTTKVYLFPMLSEKSKSRLMSAEEYENWIERFIGYGDYSDEVKDQIRAGVIEISE